MKLNRVYFYNGRQYGPGEADVPEEIAGLIKSHQSSKKAANEGKTKTEGNQKAAK
jgi:hypothetical protein